MILTGNEIKLQREAGNIIISDWEESRLGPNSYNLRLSPELMVWGGCPDPKQDNRTGRLMIPRKAWCCIPGGSTWPKPWNIPRPTTWSPMLVGRSSTAPGHLLSNVTAGFKGMGFPGTDLELTCVPVRVYPGMEICQIYYQTTTGESRIYQELSNE